jgi:hypothetical protein
VIRIIRRYSCSAALNSYSRMSHVSAAQASCTLAVSSNLDKTGGSWWNCMMSSELLANDITLGGVRRSGEDDGGEIGGLCGE